MPPRCPVQELRVPIIKWSIHYGLPELKPITEEMLVPWLQDDKLDPNARKTDTYLTFSKELQEEIAPAYNQLIKTYPSSSTLDLLRNFDENNSKADLITLREQLVTETKEYKRVDDLMSKFWETRDCWWKFQSSFSVSCGEEAPQTVRDYLENTRRYEAVIKQIDRILEEREENQKKEKEKEEQEKKEKEEQEKKEKEEREKKEKEEQEKKEKEEREKKEREEKEKEKLTKEQVYITFETTGPSAVLLLRTHINDTDHSIELKSSESGVVTVTGRGGNPTSNPVALFVRKGNEYVITGRLSFEADGSGNITSADAGNSHLTTTLGNDAQHYSITWDGMSQ